MVSGSAASFVAGPLAQLCRSDDGIDLSHDLRVRDFFNGRVIGFGQCLPNIRLERGGIAHKFVFLLHVLGLVGARVGKRLLDLSSEPTVVPFGFLSRCELGPEGASGVLMAILWKRYRHPDGQGESLDFSPWRKNVGGSIW